MSNVAVHKKFYFRSMPDKSPRKLLRLLAATTLPLMLSACDMVVMNPTGDIAIQQRNLILVSTGLMLLIIVPVMVLIVLFAWRYRQGSGATYDPNFDHSTPLELVIWACPLLIIIFLGAITWSSTHLLDPFRPLERIAPGRPVPAGTKPLDVQVIALDWKWLFIYPEQGIATVNELAVPVDVPIRFSITSTDQMNTFYAPTLAGMIYAMPGMQSMLNAVLNKPGDTWGYSGNYTGAGYSDMRFKLRGMAPQDFQKWVASVKQERRSLTLPTYVALAKPSEKVPVMRFGTASPGLFDRVVNRCVEPGKPCAAAVMMHDRMQGGGDPAVARAGEGIPPGREAGPMIGSKPKAPLQKEPDEKGSGPNVTKKGSPPPGQLAPGDQRNRDLSFNALPFPRATRVGQA